MSAVAPLLRHVQPRQPGDAFPDWWAGLHARAAWPEVFLSREWLETWLDIYGAGFDGHWLWWTSDGQVVGGCLLQSAVHRRAGFGFRTLSLNAAGATAARSPLAEYNDVLHVAGYERPIAQDLAAYLGSLRWHRFTLAACRDGGVVHQALHRLADAVVQDLDPRPAFFVDLASISPANFESTLRSNTRSQIQRTRRLYERSAGPVQLSVAATLDDTLTLFRELAVLHNERWAAKGIAGSFSNDAANAFHEALIAKLWPQQSLELVGVRAGSTLVGCLYNFTAHGNCRFYQSGFSYTADNKLKPGLLTHALAIDHYRLRGFAEYDFLAGDAQYKRSLASDERMLFWATLYRRRGMGRLLHAAKRLKARWRAWRNPGAPT